MGCRPMLARAVPRALALVLLPLYDLRVQLRRDALISGLDADIGTPSPCDPHRLLTNQRQRRQGRRGRLWL